MNPSIPPTPISISGGKDLASILLQAIEEGVSDIHLSVGEPPMYRLHGSVTQTDLPLLDRESLHSMLYDILDDDQRKTLERDKELDFAMAFGEHARFRVNCFYTMRGEGAVFRIIPTRIKTLEELNMPKVLKTISDKPRGLVLVTGPTGSGKSTTLSSMVDYINCSRDDHILTIEDPIEFVHIHKRCIVNQREVGSNTKSFASALRSALREDPDVILVGEMRDLETISLALSAAETGHLVLGTLHTQSAPKTCDRIIDVFPPQQQTLVRTMFAESFQAIICQTLIPKKDGSGRVCAMEIMIGITATRALIRDAKTYQLPTIIQTSARMGMQSLDQNIKNLLMRGIINERDALMRANNPEFIVAGGQAKLEAMQGGVSTSVLNRAGARLEGSEGVGPSPAPPPIPSARPARAKPRFPFMPK
jgi:twitching motility protein PilT